jgi:ABC-type transport system substrate-binding protein
MVDSDPMTGRQWLGCVRPFGVHSLRRGDANEGRRVTRRLRLALAWVLAAVWTWIPGAHAEPVGELRVALPWTPENLDPTMNLASIRAAVDVSLFDSLVGRDADNRIVPQLAESWKLIDELTWQFKLRRGVVFHNGELFNAEAVRATVDRVLDPNQKSPNRANIAEIVRVEVLDEATVNVVTQKPYAPLLNRLVDFARMTRSTSSWIRGGRRWTPPSGARSTPISAAPWSRTRRGSI